MKTKFVPRKYKKQQLPLYLHITGNSERERLLLDIQINKKYWCDKSQRIDLRSVKEEKLKKQLEDVNLIIDNIDSKITNIKTVYRLSEIVLTPKKLKKELLEDLPRVNFCSFFSYSLKEERNLLKPGTYRRLESVLNKLKKYDDQIIFSDITVQWIEKYKIHLSKLGNRKTTINSNIKVIKKFLRKAENVGIKFPCKLDDIKAGSTTGTKTALEQFELVKLKKYFDSEFINKNHKLILGYFLFSCMTGLRFEDVMNLQRENMLNNTFQFKAEKVQKTQTITLNNTAKYIIQSDEKLFVKKLTNEYINRELKKIMRNIGITKKISFHCSRHTFATSFLKAGGKVEDLQKLMGHSTINQSMDYVHIVAADANKNIFLLDNLL
jgi:integrase